MLEHGGRLRQAAADYGIPLAEWLDLSTGINPRPWPVPALPIAAWQRLPEENDGLEAAAAAYYGNAGALPVAGSQAAIQALPRLFPPDRLTCVTPLYAEHALAWQRAGHAIDTQPASSAGMERAKYALLCNPNNPTAQVHRPVDLLALADAIRRREGWLVVDEAFIDATPEASLTPLAGSTQAPNLIVFRSLGKFFGLAGARVGFVFAAAELRRRLAEALGPWTVSGPSRLVARRALQDAAWQATARRHLAGASRRLHALLASYGEVSSTALFATLRGVDGPHWHDSLARQGILTRHFPEHALLRFGLPGVESDWQRLAQALANCAPSAA
jgi:cobalamin biosynthetic protein CobC